MKSLVYAYRDRRAKRKRDFQKTVDNKNQYVLHPKNGMSYSRFMNGLKSRASN